jgi:hypothetical protein
MGSPLNIGQPQGLLLQFMSCFHIKWILKELSRKSLRLMDSDLNVSILTEVML